ncbi:MAG TPA: DUF6531 domain-containing protein [Vicinamibacterales bacterium]|nr:DUF6531 domain-containing protein [Vicinamibacterales bacterium]
MVNEISITPVPLDRPPFPLPESVDVPIYFTIQPGGAYVEVPGSNGYQRGARLIYPNYRGRPPNTPMEFWHYDPENGRRWYVYGNGTVGADGRQVFPDIGVSIHEFTGAMVAPPSWGPPLWAKIVAFFAGDPVDLGSGLFILDDTDIELPDTLPISLTRTYRPNDSRSRSFGIGAAMTYDMFLVGDSPVYSYIDLVLASGTRIH